MKKVLIIMIGVLLVCGSVFAAGEQESGEKKLEIAIVPMFVGHPWFVRCEEGAKKAAEELGIDYVFVGPEKADAAKQLDIFTDQVNKGVDAIITATSDVDAWGKPIEDAISNGVPVFGFDIGAPGTLWFASGWAAEQSGINIAEGIADEINGKGKVAILTGSLGSAFLAARQKACEDTLAKYPGIEVIGVFPTDDDYEKALSICESIIQANPDVKGFASLVTTGVPASAKALDNAGVESGVAVWGVALAKQNAEYIKNGLVKGALLLDPAKMTYLAVRIAYDYLTNDGQLPAEGDEFGWAGIPATIVSDKASYAPDVLLTPENVDTFGF